MSCDVGIELLCCIHEASSSVVCVQNLISDCWAQDATDRPDARTIVQRLIDLQSTVDEMDARNPRGVIKSANANNKGGQPSSTDGSCCTIC